MNDGKICVSVCAETADEMIANIKRAEEFADVIEVRFDCLSPEYVEKCFSEISNMKFEKFLLATYRSREQDGNCRATFEERTEFWQHERKGFWAGDLEEDVFDSGLSWPMRIVSFHDFNGVPKNFGAVIKRLASSEADVVKVATQADDITDALPVWNLIETTKLANKKCIPIAMGEAGKWTRILGLAHGAFLTYAALENGGETAPGQFTARELVETYHVKDLDRSTKVYGIIGDPVSRSLSPAMLNPAFAEAGINAVYIPFLVKNLDEFIRRMVKPATCEVELNFGGFSVTMPHKETIITHLDAIDPISEKIGAVNTVKIGDDGKLIGYNTDVYGFITPLKDKFGDLKNARVAVCGAGGAARACVFALTQEKADVAVFGRGEQKTRLLAKEFGVEGFAISDFGSEISNDLSRNFDIIVNTTPLGMKGPFESESLFTSEQLKGVNLVYDLVTKQSDTPLIREAKKAKIPVIGGIEMLVAQGAKQFEIWTGLTVSVDILKGRLLA